LEDRCKHTHIHAQTNIHKHTYKQADTRGSRQTQENIFVYARYSGQTQNFSHNYIQVHKLRKRSKRKRRGERETERETGRQTYRDREIGRERERQRRRKKHRERN